MARESDLLSRSEKGGGSEESRVELARGCARGFRELKRPFRESRRYIGQLLSLLKGLDDRGGSIPLRRERRAHAGPPVDLG